MLTNLLLATTLVSSSAHHHADELPINCRSCSTWNLQQAPFKIYGNSYYVGVNGLSSVLITSNKGHFLIDGGLPQSAKLIAKNIEQLGFSIKDVKWLLNSHAHYDHAGGLAALQRMSGAKLAASEDSAQAMKTGSALANDPQAGYGEAMNFPAISNISIITDGERIELGKNVVTAIFTPGHSPGGTSWTWQSCEASKCVTLVFADSLGSVSDDTYQFSAHPEYLTRFKKSIENVRALKCDIIIAAHPGFSGLFEKAQTNQFIDENSCKKYADNAQINLDKRLAEELKN
jgi:metallo-beta-lactamase class B